MPRSLPLVSSPGTSLSLAQWLSTAWRQPSSLSKCNWMYSVCLGLLQLFIGFRLFIGKGNGKVISIPVGRHFKHKQLFEKDWFIILGVFSVCSNICMYTACVCVGAMGARRGCWIPSRCSNRWLWASGYDFTLLFCPNEGFASHLIVKHSDALLGVVLYTFYPNLEEADEFNFSLVYTVSSRLAGATKVIT